MKKKGGKIRALGLLIFIPLFCISAYNVSSQLIVDYRQEQTFSALIEQVNQARANGAAGTADAGGQGAVTGEQGSAAGGQGTAADAPEGYIDAQENGSVASEGGIAIEQNGANGAIKMNMLPIYAALHEMNPDFFGWIEIKGTVVNYPVMHTPKDPEFYLHRAFDGREAYSGVPFMDAYCFYGCGNYIVYGHNMKNKTMFKTITYYEDVEFWKEHPTVQFDTLYDEGTYDVVAAFYSQVYPEGAKNAFPYYQYNDLREEQRFTEYATQIKAASLYDTGIELKYGDQLLTLSTCEYHRTDGRFVVVAKRR